MNQNPNYQGGQQGYNQQTPPGYGPQQGYNQQGYGPGYGYQQSVRPYVETTANNAFNCGPEGKSRGVFCILALIFGSIGLHYFYVNKVGAGIMFIVLGLVTCGLWAIIPILQGIIILWTMRNEEFDAKFVASDSFMPIF